MTLGMRPNALLARLDAAGWGYVYDGAEVRASSSTGDATITVAIRQSDVRLHAARGPVSEIVALIDEVTEIARGPHF